MAHLEMLHGGSMSTVQISNPALYPRPSTTRNVTQWWTRRRPRARACVLVFIAGQSQVTFTFTLVCHLGKTHSHRSRGDTTWGAQRSKSCQVSFVAAPPRLQHTVSKDGSAVVGQSVHDSQSFSCFATPRVHSSTVSGSAGDSDDRQNSSTIMTFKREQSG